MSFLLSLGRLLRSAFTSSPSSSSLVSPLSPSSGGPDRLTPLPSSLLLLLFHCLPPQEFLLALSVASAFRSLRSLPQSEVLFRRFFLAEVDRYKPSDHSLGEFLTRLNAFVVSASLSEGERGPVRPLLLHDRERDVVHCPGPRPRVFYAAATLTDPPPPSPSPTSTPSHVRGLHAIWKDRTRDNQHFSQPQVESSLFGRAVRLKSVFWLDVVQTVPLPLDRSPVVKYRVLWRVGLYHTTTMQTPTVGFRVAEEDATRVRVLTEQREWTDSDWKHVIINQKERIYRFVPNDIMNSISDTSASERKKAENVENDVKTLNGAEGDENMLRNNTTGHPQSDEGATLRATDVLDEPVSEDEEGEVDQEEVENLPPPRNQAEALMRHTHMRMVRQVPRRINRHPRFIRSVEPDTDCYWREIAVGEIEVRAAVGERLNGNNVDDGANSIPHVTVWMQKTDGTLWNKHSFLWDAVILERM